MRYRKEKCALSSSYGRVRIVISRDEYDEEKSPGTEDECKELAEKTNFVSKNDYLRRRRLINFKILGKLP